MKSLLLILSLLASPVVSATDVVQKDIIVYGQNIHYAEAGSGPPVILLHGLWGGLNEWQPIIEPLSQSNRVIVMDFIGFHVSSKPDTDYHNAFLSQFLAGFIQALGLSDVTLIGHAMGANTATYTAIHHPENLRALVLVDGAGYRSTDRDLAKPMSEDMIRFRRTATGSSLESTRGLLERRVKDKSIITDAWVEEAFAMWVNSANAIGDMMIDGGDVADEEMRGIRLPTLVIWGAEDKVFSPDNASRLKTDIEQSEVHIIERSGHLPQIEQTDAFLAALFPFLKSTGAAQ
ncbi:MAG: alpha/beta hydrolase [Proteobacteria bacterium]|nr:alpha/beta hydrolase [Pseudomonadota bacterium]MDA0994498.1 alpha/beta hydrolase [Pseudomonadota bacterium]